MEIRVNATYEEMSEAACNMLIKQINKKPDAVLGLASGSTPLRLYEMLSDANKRGLVDFSRVRTFNLDEYIGLSPDNEQSYHYFMTNNFYSKVNLKPENVFIPNGMADDIATECAQYSAALEAAGGIDIMVLGIGANAHIGFNEPGDSFVAETHVVELTETTRAANARFFVDEDDIPHWAISMGIRDIMYAHNILLLANGAGKTEAVYKAVCGDITPMAPASVLQLHRNVLVLTDEAAAARLPADFT